MSLHDDMHERIRQQKDSLVAEWRRLLAEAEADRAAGRTTVADHKMREADKLEDAIDSMNVEFAITNSAK